MKKIYLLLALLYVTKIACACVNSCQALLKNVTSRKTLGTKQQQPTFGIGSLLNFRPWAMNRHESAIPYSFFA
ncbi:hypothetical protein [Mangrovibacterium marinum]|uniref:hypothetical protein n=1 Tax=Mangrovibacterium marinum TaxID=1639118 RepID=UPI0011B22A80|nr:hypothetical protein [Mangrovibacterium marinum]